MKIGPYQLKNNLILAPMAGVTDLPFRSLCRRFGAGLVMTEMIDCNPRMRQQRDTQLRLSFANDESPRVAHISGSGAAEIADTAKFCVQQGAEIIDINMGCPARKICNKNSGAAWLKDEMAAAKMLSMVVGAVAVPVTIKIRTGWDAQHKNALQIAKIAEEEGIQAITVHGRTRADGYNIPAEYDTVKSIKVGATGRSPIKIPVIVNGDIDSREKLQAVLEYTKADGIMIGRAALGQPWIFAVGATGRSPVLSPIHSIMREHLQMLHDFYGEKMGVLLARKHMGWYLQNQKQANLIQQFNALETSRQQVGFVDKF
jgi:tRNA-dihydrouridine synthase B